jgi:hypothetical protein
MLLPDVILNVGGMDFAEQQTPAGVDQIGALAPLDLFAAIIAARPAGFGRLDALAVNDCRSRMGIASAPLAVALHQREVDLFEDRLIPKAAEPAIERAARRKLLRQSSPDHAIA